jgi:hypothetical protein
MRQQQAIPLKSFPSGELPVKVEFRAYLAFLLVFPGAITPATATARACAAGWLAVSAAGAGLTRHRIVNRRPYELFVGTKNFSGGVQDQRAGVVLAIM